MPVDEEDCPRRYTSGWSRFWRCIKGGGQMVVGMGVAVASFETGVGFWAGILVATRGLDNIVAAAAGDRPAVEKIAGQVYIGFGLDPNQAQRAGDFTGDVVDLALGSVARGASEPAGAAGGVDPNKLHHIFDNPGHGLEGVVAASGSTEAAFDALKNAVQGALDGGTIAADPRGVFETVVNVAGVDVTVRGAVVDGVARIGSAWR